MLVRFVVSNYLSFGEETEFNMLTGSVRRKKEHIYQFGDVELLKTAAIYGPNGAGKSNLVRAISLLQECVIDKDDDGIDAYLFPHFRLKDINNQKPIQFEIEFIKNKKMYSYGLSVFHNEIVEEFLYETGKNTELIFERELKKGETKIKFNDKMLQTPEDELRRKLYEEELLPKTKPLLRMMANARRQFKDITNAYLWFKTNLTTIYPTSKFVGLASRYHFNENFRKFINDVINTFNTGITSLKLDSIPIDRYFGEDDREQLDKVKDLMQNDNTKFVTLTEDFDNSTATVVWEQDNLVVKKIYAEHEDGSKNIFKFDIDEESDGTQRILDFTPAFFDIITMEKTFVIDEIDQSIHPHLLKKLVAKFINDNDTKGQLIFTTHDSNLLDQNIFRQDEIWFTEKKKTGETTMYPLSDFKIRHDLDIEKGYLKGRFGAIPFLGNLDDLNWHKYAS